MAEKNSIKKNLLFNILYQMLNTLAPLITVPYISRVLGAGNVGEYSYSLAIVNYFCIFGALGSSVFGQLEISKVRNDSEKRSRVFTTICISRLITFSIALALYMLFMSTQGVKSALYTVLLTYFMSQVVDIAWLFQGLERFDITVPCNALAKILSIICIFIFIKTSNDLLLYTGLINGSFLVGNLLMWVSVRKYVSFCKVGIREATDSIRRNLTFFFPTIAIIVFGSVDKCMIAWITKSNVENGYYEQASKIYNVLVTLITALTTVMLPRMTYLWQDDNNSTKIKDYLIKTIRYVAMITFPIAAGIFAIADEFVPVFFGDGYDKCIILCRIFSIILILTSFNSIISNQCLVASGKQSTVNKLLTISSCVNVVLNLVLIYFWKSSGAALASLASEAVLLFTIIICSRKILPNTVCIKYVLKYMAFALAMAVLILPLKLLHIGMLARLLIEIFAGIVLYGVILLVSRDDLLLELETDVLRKFSSIRN